MEPSPLRFTVKVFEEGEGGRVSVDQGEAVVAGGNGEQLGGRRVGNLGLKKIYIFLDQKTNFQSFL